MEIKILISTHASASSAAAVGSQKNQSYFLNGK
jgi:hypothetical protein